MRTYSSTGVTAVSGTPPTSIVSLTSTTTVRPVVVEVAWGCHTTPADQALRMGIKRTTTTGTATATTPKAHDPADPASLLGSGARAVFTAEPSKGDTLYDIGIHQRSSYRWQTTGDRAWILPATANYGLVLECTSISSGTPTIAGTIVHQE
jgi:hypothetical protein